MYPSAMDYARDGGTALIPTRFVWPYGGRSVYLSGTFTGWSQWPMAPVEGCPTVFQTVCSVPPGYHQYKFIVDGEWRHDENQPFVSGSLGTVNTVLLARESDYLPAVLSAQIPPSSNMDVDNQAFQRLVRVSDVALPDDASKISQSDLDISRHRISAVLSTHSAYELLPGSTKVIALDVDLPVKQAFHILHEQGIPMAPLWDFSRAQFVGVLSALDFILIMRELGNHGSNLTEEELETHTISAWKEAKSYLSRQANELGKSAPRQLVWSGPDNSLKDVALEILQNGVATVPIIHSPAQDGSYPQLLYLASLSEILKHICRYFKHSPESLPILQLPIGAIPLGTWVPKIGEPNRQPLAMLRPTASLNAALNLLVQAQVSAIPIVDDNDSLLDIYSRSDITALAKDKIYTHINLEEMSIHQALQLAEEPYATYGLSSQKCHMCLRSDSLHEVMERLSRPGVRRVVVVEAGSKRVEGIISVGDIFKFLLGKEPKTSQQLSPLWVDVHPRLENRNSVDGFPITQSTDFPNMTHYQNILTGRYDFDLNEIINESDWENITQDEPVDLVNIDNRDLPNYGSPSASDSDDLPNVEESGDNVPFEASSSDDDFFMHNRLPRSMSMSPFHDKGCRFRPTSFNDKHTNMWKVERYIKEHTCDMGTCRDGDFNLNVEMISSVLRSDIEKMSRFPFKDCQTNVLIAYDILIRRRKAYYDRKCAFKKVYGTWEGSFAELPRFMEALKRFNPG
ncbi:hypothetical protein KY290_003885 [Solanum tuberosum]|uniref:CBS domain-containing protein n=1 Tax=Solanum tuberosum TaxID=4113 RepID=A0ABQ7WU50_SOLTU|nr:hypothetical protein KY289_004224 [Solanum tuberosum]KAH0784287.1 hypothetical protein KY290_003885 [Solanum tuberosum]